MGVEKEGSKHRADHVGGFFQLFDWTSKSRKKLFSSNSDSPERSKHGKKNYANLPIRQHQVDEDETGVTSSVKAGSNYSCASSVTDEEGFGTKAPSVVARLMGLDSLPTSNFSEPYATPYFDTQSLQEAPYRRKNVEVYRDDQLMYSGNLLTKMEAPTRNPLESKPQRLLSKPFERFQTETLPPRSARSIPITHHKLLSPIKNPGFVPSRNAAHIMEAAAKIIEPGPPATVKAKMPLIGSSSITSKVEAPRKVLPVRSSSETLKGQDLKDIVEAAYKRTRSSEVSQKPVESNAGKYLKGQSLNKSWNGYVDLSFRASSSTEENKGKSISLAIQAKVNVQKRGENLSRSRSLLDQREQSEVDSNQPFRSQPNVQKFKPALKQNNQKQNCLVDKDKLSSKPLVLNPQGKKVLFGDPSSGRHRSSFRSSDNSKIGSRKLGSEAMDSGKEVLCSNEKDYSRKKRSIDRSFQFSKDRATDDMLSDKKQKPFQSNPVTEKHYSWAEDSKKKGMDVVSFTFTAPLTRSLPRTDSAQAAQKNNSLCMAHRGKRLMLDTDNMKLSSLGYNVIEGDALSVLLERKLRELSYGTESFSHDSVKVGYASTETASTSDVKPNFSAVSSMQGLNDRRDQHLSVTEELGGRYGSDLSDDLPAFRLKQKFPGADNVDEYSRNMEAGLSLNGRHPSPVSVLEPTFSNESYESSVSADSTSTEASRLCSSIQGQEVHVFSFLKKFHSVDADNELLDSASSTCLGMEARNHTATDYVTDSFRSNEWELAYMKETLCNVELMFKDFALGRAQGMINPHFFNLLESRRGQFESDGDESKLRRKELFDCTSECLDLRCRRYVGGGYRSWVKGAAMVRRKECLAREVYKEVSGWRSMWDCMVDDLLDKDMSSQYSRWLDFQTDEFELGVDVEGQILNSLIEEVVADILHL